MSVDELPSRDALWGFVLRFVQYKAGDTSVNVRREHSDAFPLLFGVCQRVRRFARAYQRLDRCGMAPAGQPLVRAALEQAVTAQWVFYVRDGAKRFSKEVTLDQLRLAQLAGGLPNDDPFVMQLRESIPAVRGMPTWKQIREALDDPTSFLSHSYQVLSQSVHVTHGAIRDSIVVDDDGGMQLLEAPSDDFGHQVLYTLAASCMLAWWLEATSYGDDERLRRLQQEGMRLSMAWRLDHHLPVESLRFIDDPPSEQPGPVRGVT